MERFTEILESARKDKIFTGCALIVASDGIILEKYFGNESEEGEPVTSSHYFDLASLTKPIAIVTAFMMAQSDSKIDIFSDKLSHIFPAGWLTPFNRDLPLWTLLAHCGGFLDYKPFYRHYIDVEPQKRKESLIKDLLKSPLEYRPGTRSLYSDLGYLVLGEVLEIVYEKPLLEIFSKVMSLLEVEGIVYGSFSLPKAIEVTTPLEDKYLVSPSVATSFCNWRRRLLKGEVHDENCFVLGGVSGHAGLFGTAKGVYKWLSKLFNIWKRTEKNSPIKKEVIRDFWDFSHILPGSTWVIGFDTPSKEGSTAGDLFPKESVGHLGFTGTSFWLDLLTGFSVILLTNRVYYSCSKELINNFRREIHNRARLEYEKSY